MGGKIKLNVLVPEHLELKYGLTIATNQKQQLQHVIVNDVSQVLQNYKPENIKAVNKNLIAMQSDIRLQNYKGGIIYYKVDDKGKRLTRSSKSSSFKDTAIAYPKLVSQFQQNKTNRLEAKQIIEQSLPQKGKIYLAEFNQKLQAQGITPIYYKSEKGIYGASFNYKNHTYKGSEIDRNLSFGKIKERLDILPQKDQVFQIALVEKLQAGEYIDIPRSSFRSFDTQNPVIDNGLNQMDYYDSRVIAKTHNEYVDLSVRFDVGKLVNEYEEQLEDFLRKRHQNNLTKDQRKQRLRIPRY